MKYMKWGYVPGNDLYTYYQIEDKFYRAYFKFTTDMFSEITEVVFEEINKKDIPEGKNILCK